MHLKIAGAALVALLAGTAAAQTKVVNVYNWSDYIDQEVLAEFTAETGIRVVYDVFDSNEVLETKILAGGSGYDIVVPTGDFLQRQIAAGVYQKLDRSKLPNIVNMWPRIAELTSRYDPDNAYSINYMWGTTGIGYNRAAVQARLGTDRIESWSVIFDPEQLAKFADCGIYVLDTPNELFPAAQNYLGLDPTSQNPDDIRAAAALMARIRPLIQQFHSSAYIDALANGDICLAVGWSGDVLQARDRAAEADAGVEVDYAIPKEGAQMWFDQMVIPTDAPNVENAHAFLDFIMRPEVIAKVSNYVNFANGNLASKVFLNEEVIGDPAIYPSDDTIDNLWVIDPYGPNVQRIVTREWTRIKTGS